MREMGIALATSISSWANVLILFIILKSKNNISLDLRLINNIFKILICSFIMAIACYILNNSFFVSIDSQSVRSNIAFLVSIIVVCKIIYIGMIYSIIDPLA